MLFHSIKILSTVGLSIFCSWIKSGALPPPLGITSTISRFSILVPRCLIPTLLHPRQSRLLPSTLRLRLRSTFFQVLSVAFHSFPHPGASRPRPVDGHFSSALCVSTPTEGTFQRPVCFHGNKMGTFAICVSMETDQRLFQCPVCFHGNRTHNDAGRISPHLYLHSNPGDITVIFHLCVSTVLCAGTTIYCRCPGVVRGPSDQLLQGPTVMKITCLLGCTSFHSRTHTLHPVVRCRYKLNYVKMKSSCS